MGAYLSQPITKKESTDGTGEHLLYGDSSMQGWRVSQEDAHNSLPDLAPGCSLFAVYDGHGGHEVAAYAAQTLPAAITACPLYKSGKVRESLRRAFLEFDSSLTRPEIIEKLKILAGREIESEDEEETDREVDELFQEAHMPLDELMARYQGGGDKPTPPAAAGGVAKLKGKTKEKPLSPFLRAKAGGSGAGSSSSGPGGSSSGSSAAADEDVKKDLTAEIKSEENSESADGVKSEPSTDTAATETKVKAESDVKPDPDGTADTAKTESNSESNSESKSEIIKAESKSSVKSADKADGVDKPASKTNGNAGSGEPADSADAPADGDATNSASGDAPACNGNGTASSKSSPRGKGGKGARPGSGKSPAPAAAAAAAARGRAAARGTRRLPERAAAEVYKEVLEGARKAREAGHDHVEDEEEEEDEDDDFSLEQSDSVDDDDNDVEDDDDDDDEEEEEEEEEEEDEDDSEEEDDEMGDEESAEDEDSDFMFNMKDEPGSDSGCTAVVALLHGRQLYVANIGDSRCVLSRSGRAVDMSDDHKPEDEPELQRIVKAGGKVTMDGRVNGGLNLSRAFGDHAYKADAKLPAEEQMISACPDVRCVTIEPGTDEFMVLACDGIWNSKKSQEVVDFVSERIRERGETQLSKICEELFDECLASNTMGDGTGCDNMTCIIVRFMPSLATVPAPIPVEDGATDSATDEKAEKTEEKAEEAKEATKEEGDASAAPRPDPEGAPPEKRQRTE